MQGFKGYTAESRHKDSAWLITSDGAERREVMVRRALGDSRPVGTADVWENVARNLARQPAKASALDFMDRARDVGRTAAHAMQAGFRCAEAREAAGEPWATLGAQLRERRDVRVVGHAVDRLRQALDARWQAVRELADRLRQAGRTVLQDGGREERRPAANEAKAVRDRAWDNQVRSTTAAERHRAPRPKADPARPVDAAAYWRRMATAKDGAPRPSVRRAVQRRREEGAVAVVADRLALALDERGAVLAGIGRDRDQKPAEASQEGRRGNEGERTPERPAAPSQAIPTPSARATAAPGRCTAPRFTEADAAADFAMALHRAGLRVAGPVEMDGKMHRVPVEGDRKGQKSGTFVGHLDGWPAGYIRNYKTGTEIRWKADRPVLQMAPAERAAFAAEAAPSAVRV
ncbi:MAG: hypothetical protein EON47_21060, partial [Acetobacteraceae bacterium]